MSERTRATRQDKPGRPHKGNRHLFQSRVPQPLAETVMGEAARRGLTFSDYIALVLAERHEYPLPDHYYGRSDGSVQEALPMQNAS